MFECVCIDLFLFAESLETERQKHTESQLQHQKELTRLTEDSGKQRSELATSSAQRESELLEKVRSAEQNAAAERKRSRLELTAVQEQLQKAKQENAMVQA